MGTAGNPVTAFEGWRVWRVANPAKGILMAAAMNYRWKGPVLTIPDEDVEGIQDGGGFHSFRAREAMLEYCGPRAWVRGAIRHYGVVAEYERGFRSTSAIITSLEAPDVWDDHFVTRLANRYQCEVTTYTPPPEPEKQGPVFFWSGSSVTYRWDDGGLKSDYIILGASPLEIAKPTLGDIEKYATRRTRHG